ncbi:MAG: 2-amino-4-hydroxy-6-hydroxymethyldihydropteridine diphosphokinase [Bacteroidota bacterium]
MRTYTAYLGLGSNLGDRAGALRKAAAELGMVRRTRPLRASSVYETEPHGGAGGGKFLNACVQVETELEPREMLEAIKDIEVRLGRVDRGRGGAREIDLDILLYEGLAVEEEDLAVPHPGLPQRRFVLVPLREIAPDVVHPVSGHTVEELAAACRDPARVVQAPHHIVL